MWLLFLSIVSTTDTNYKQRELEDTQDLFYFRVLHLTDVRGHYMPVHKRWRTSCSMKDAIQGLPQYGGQEGDVVCVGGISRVSNYIKQIRQSQPNDTIFLDGGNFYHATLFFHKVSLLL